MQELFITRIMKGSIVQDVSQIMLTNRFTQQRINTERKYLNIFKMKDKDLEQRAIQAAMHMNEFFDAEDLDIYVKWSTQKRYHPYQAMLRLQHDVKKDFHKGEFKDSIKYYMVNVSNYYNAMRFRRNDGKISQDKKDR